MSLYTAAALMNGSRPRISFDIGQHSTQTPLSLLHPGIIGNREPVGDARGAERHGDVQVSVRILVALISVEQERSFNLGLAQYFWNFRNVLQAIWLVLWPDDVEAYIVLEINVVDWNQSREEEGKGFEDN